MKLRDFGEKWRRALLFQIFVCSAVGGAQNNTAAANYTSTNALDSSSIPINITRTLSTTLPTTTTNTTAKASSTPINTPYPGFKPEECEQQWNVENDVAPIQFLSFKPLYITQERSTVRLHCGFCVTHPTEWSNALWYKDDKLIESGVDTLTINHARHRNHEGIYRCDVITSTNHTETRTITLIINKDPQFSVIPSVWAKNVSYTQATKVLWQVRGGGIFDAVHVTVKLRQLSQPTWLYIREYKQFVSGSTEFYNLEPSTVYFANVTAVTSYGMNAECRSISFWSNARNSTEFESGVLNLDYCTRQLLGLITGVLGLVCTVLLIYCCCFNPACEYRNHRGYTTTSRLDSIQKNDNTHDEKELDVDCHTTEDTHMKV